MKPCGLLKCVIHFTKAAARTVYSRLCYWRLKWPMLMSVIRHGGNYCRFWEAVQQLKALPQKDVQDKVDEIWTEFLASDASCPINVDAQSYEITKKNMETPDRWSFDVAAVSIHTLVTRLPEVYTVMNCFCHLHN